MLDVPIGAGEQHVVVALPGGDHLEGERWDEGEVEGPAPGTRDARWAGERRAGCGRSARSRHPVPSTGGVRWAGCSTCWNQGRRDVRRS